MEVKTEKIAEIEQSACANLIVVMLKSLFYAKKGIPMISGAMKTGPQNRRTLVVQNCIPGVAGEKNDWTTSNALYGTCVIGESHFIWEPL